MQGEAKNAVNPNGLTSILTRQCGKSALKKQVRIILACLGKREYGISRIGKVWRRVNPPPYHISIFFCAVNITDSAGVQLYVVRPLFGL